MSGRPLVISHRTNMGTAAPNSLAGIDAAVRDGVDGVEADVRCTRDGVPVLLHDPTVRPLGAGTRALSDLTVDGLRSCRLADPHVAGQTYAVPTLADALALIAGRTLLVLDVKVAGLAEATARVFRAVHIAQPCWIWAFDAAVLEEFRAVLPSSPRALLVAPDSPLLDGYAYLDAARDLDCEAVSLDHSLVSAPVVERARHRGLRVYAWTVDEEDDLARMAAAGVDAVCSDAPDRVLRYWSSRIRGLKT